MKINQPISTRSLLEWTVRAVIILGIIGLIYFIRTSPNPAPAAIKKQLTFKVIYPKGNGFEVNQDSWNYDTQNKTLTFSANKQGTTVIMNEQKLPIELNTVAAYNQFVGKLKPDATFQTHAGSVAITHLYTYGTFNNFGQTALLNSNNVLFAAHVNMDISNDDWALFFNSLKVSR